MTAWKTQTQIKEKHIVLIVSQDVKMVSAWELVFRKKGCYVIHEQTPRHALQAARLISPTLVIVDLDLPQPESIALCKELRPMTGRALFLLAPKTSDYDTAEYYKAGVDESLPPTVSPNVLLSKSLAWLS